MSTRCTRHCLKHCRAIHPFGSIVYCLVLALLAASSPAALAEEAWEFAPYKVCIWFSMDPALDTSTVDHQS
jgi:hypothetical protein